MKAIKVEKSKAEEVRKLAEKIGAKDKSRLIIQDGEYVIIPIYNGYENQFKEFEIIIQDNPVFKKKRDLKSILKNEVPRDVLLDVHSFKIIGDIAMVKLGKNAEKYAELIANKIMEAFPRIKAVWQDLGREGMLRKPNVRLLAGKKSETIHKEHSCLFKLDIRKVMFSVGNQYEKLRIANLVRDGEVVVDMFAGIGYFTIPIANHSKAERIYSIEINPEAYTYLLENLKINRIRNVTPILGDSKYVCPEGVANRVVMGHLFAESFIEVAINALDEKGIIHYHESVPERIIKRPIERVMRVAKRMGKNCKILNFRKVKNYSPGVVHVVVDAEMT